MPAVSMISMVFSSKRKESLTESRVVPGISETIDLSQPMKALRSVDLPAFGFPTREILRSGSPILFGECGSRSAILSRSIGMLKLLFAEIGRMSFTPNS